MSNQTSRKPAGGPAGPAGRGTGGNRPAVKGAGGRPASPPSGAPPTRPATPPSRASAAPAPSSRGDKISVSAARPSSSRVSRPVPQQKGFRLRPLDLALIALGVVGVVALVWAVLSNSSSTSSAATVATTTQYPPGDPRARLSQRNVVPVTMGQPAPDFTLPATDGKTYSLSQFRGKVVVLELMAPWCPHCQAHATDLNQIYAKYKDKPVQVLAVNASPFGQNHESGDDSLITMADQVWFHDTFGLQYPLLFDKDVTEADTYGITSFPTVFVIDRKGKFSAEPDSPVSVDGISQAVDAALAAPSALRDGASGLVAAASGGR